VEVLRATSYLAEIEHAQGRLTAAMRLVDEILADPLAAEFEEEGRVRCLQVLLAAADPRASALLQSLHDHLERVQRQLPDEASRQRLVTSLAHWRWVDREWRAAKTRVT
jgi:hypothetical protein